MSRSSKAPRIFVDSSIAIAVLRREHAIVTRFGSIAPVLSVTVLGELLYGATRAGRPQQQRERIAQLLAVSTLLTVDHMTADIYATMKRSLELRGARIPENDMWIAASALQHKLPLAALDEHFERIEGLVFEHW